MNLNELRQRFVAANLNLSDIELRSSRELRVSVPRESLTGFADYLRGESMLVPNLLSPKITRLEPEPFLALYF